MLVALVWLLRLGWIAELLSAPIITGFLAGIAVVIVVHQLPDLLGIPRRRHARSSRLKDIVDQLGSASGATLGIGSGCSRWSWCASGSTAGSPER